MFGKAIRTKKTKAQTHYKIATAIYEDETKTDQQKQTAKENRKTYKASIKVCDETLAVDYTDEKKKELTDKVDEIRTKITDMKESSEEWSIEAFEKISEKDEEKRLAQELKDKEKAKKKNKHYKYHLL